MEEKEDALQDGFSIHVNVIDGHALLWDPEEIIALRCEQRFVIQAAGSLKVSQLGKFRTAAVPAVLLPEQAYLAYEQGWIKTAGEELLIGSFWH